MDFYGIVVSVLIRSVCTEQCAVCRRPKEKRNSFVVECLKENKKEMVEKMETRLVSRIQNQFHKIKITTNEKFLHLVIDSDPVPCTSYTFATSIKSNLIRINFNETKGKIRGPKKKMI